MMQHPVYSTVIPVYNSTQTLGDLVSRLDQVFAEIGEAHEVVFVDDASPNPETWPILKALAEEHEHVHATQLMRNFGKAGAVLCGLRQAKGEWIITIDDDLQHAPEDIPILLEKKNHDVVIGAFANRKKHSILQRATSRLKNFTDAKILGVPPGVRMSPFKLFHARVVQHMIAVDTTRPFIPALMLQSTKDVVQVEITHHPRQHGRSAFGLRRRIRQFSNLIFGNASLVLRFLATLGVTISCLSLLYGGWLVLSYFWKEETVAGWTSLMVVTLTLGGLIMFSLGVIGEYLIRIIERVENRAAYLERENLR
ncbi:glycosyltransferase family 2 protein [Roseobacter litoralis]|uniref:glycosyltransferase family 2 protein n=1 Tax=Roseobacter litoralis TaxID=42443 RepID=UPI0031E6F14C